MLGELLCRWWRWRDGVMVIARWWLQKAPSVPSDRTLLSSGATSRLRYSSAWYFCWWLSKQRCAWDYKSLSISFFTMRAFSLSSQQDIDWYWITDKSSGQQYRQRFFAVSNIFRAAFLPISTAHYIIYWWIGFDYDMMFFFYCIEFGKVRRYAHWCW